MRAGTALAERRQGGPGRQPREVVGEAFEQPRRAGLHLAVWKHQRALAAVERQVSRRQATGRQGPCAFKQCGIKGQLRVFKRLAQLLAQRRTRLGLVVEDAPRRPMRGGQRIEPVEPTGELEPERGEPERPRLECQLGGKHPHAERLLPMQPVQVERSEALEPGGIGQEVGVVAVEPVLVLAGNGAQQALVVGARIGVACGFGALRVKSLQHRVQPGAVVALFQRVVKFFGLAEREHALGEEAVGAGAQGLVGGRVHAGGQELRCHRQGPWQALRLDAL